MPHTSQHPAPLSGGVFSVCLAGYDPQEDFTREHAGRRKADIALLFLASPASVAPVLLPAPTPSTIPAPGTGVHAAGYGRTQAGTTNGPTSDTLR